MKPQHIHKRRIAAVSLQNISNHDASSVHLPQRQTLALLRMARTNRSDHIIRISRPIKILVATRNQPNIHHEPFATRIYRSVNNIITHITHQNQRHAHDNKHHECSNNDSKPNS